MTDLRPYDPARDREAAHRICREVGWWHGDSQGEQAIDAQLGRGRALVAELDGTAECLVATMPATVRYLDEDLPACAVTHVTTSHVARRQGLASRLVALSLAHAAAEGELLALLGVFDQGYYDRLGFGTGSYDHWLSFDPSQLNVMARARPPRRLTVDDWEAIHAARLRRARRHGALCITPAGSTRGEMLGTRNPFGLGYYDGPDGALSHYVWLGANNVERGPYYVRWMAYTTGQELLELLALLKSLGDQIYLAAMLEPPDVQMQALLDRPFRQLEITEKAAFASQLQAKAWWQVRICDLPGCLARTHLAVGPLRLNLRLSDPIAQYLDPGAPWHGVAGDYVLTLGPSSSAERGTDAALPTLTASVNAFTRLWLGVGPAGGLAVTDGLAGPPGLLHDLDAVLRLPRPLLDWEF